MSLSQALQFGAGDKKKDVGDDVLGYIGGHELVRMPSSNWSSVRKPLLFRPRKLPNLWCLEAFVSNPPYLSVLLSVSFPESTETFIHGETHHVPACAWRFIPLTHMPH